MAAVRSGGRTRAWAGWAGHAGEQAGGRTGAQDGAGGAGGGAGALIRVCDLAGRPRGTGFLADRDGTLITSHEAVDGLARLVLHAPGEQVCLVEAEAVTPLPGCGLALVATEGLDVRPLPIAPAGPGHPERRAVLRLPQAAAATVLGTTAVTYTATDRFHLIEGVYELALDGADLAEAGPQASGTPVVDAATGAVLAVVVTALHAGHRAGGFAVPLHAASSPPPLAELVARAAATVPAYGPHLNLAGALHLAATSVGSAGSAPEPWRDPVARPRIAAALDDFLGRRGEAAPLALGLVGEPGTGRSTELAALAARRHEAAHPAPTVWLRGAELRPGDGSVKDAVERALRTAARVVSAADHAPGEPQHASLAYGMADPTEDVAVLARTAGRPLVVLLDAPEEMPPVLAHELAGWAAATAGWLRTSRTRLVVACRPEFWEQAGAMLPAELLYVPGARGGEGAEAEPGAPVRPLPPCVRLGDLAGTEAAEARERHGLPDAALRPRDAGHPLTLRLLSQVRAALGELAEEGPAPSRAEVFAAYLDAACLRIAVRLGAATPTSPPVRGRGLRRLAARVAGQAHEAARRCLGPGQGELDREAFEELFPWRTGWASAVLAEGLLVPAGAGYRFAHEEFGDWVQSLHLDLATALNALVHRWSPSAGHPVPPLVPGDAPVRLPSRAGGRSAGAGGGSGAGVGVYGGAYGRSVPVPPVPPAPPVGPSGRPRSLPVPRHRAGPVVGALLLASPESRAAHLGALVEVLDDGRPGWPGPARPPVRPVGPPTAAATAAWGRHPAGPEPEGTDLDADTVPNVRGRALVPARVAEPAPGEPWGAGRASLVPAVAPGADRRRTEAQWWAAHLLREALLRVEDAGPLLPVLRALAGRIVVRSIAAGGFVPERLGVLGEFGPWFWRAVPLAEPDRLELLRVLLPADGPPGAGREDRFLGVVSDLVREQGGQAVPEVCGWFDDDRPLQAAHPFAVGGRLTVASAAQALLHTHSRRAPDALTEALVDAGHPGADAVLVALAEDHPGAICRAVDRWAHDPRPDRRVAAATYGARVARFARGPADRELLRYAALALLARADETGLHGAALGVLVRDPATRVRYLPAALRGFAAGDPGLAPDALVEAMDTHPEMVLDAFRTRLRAAGGDGGESESEGACEGVGEGSAGAAAGRRTALRAAEVLAALAAVREPVLARRAAVLVQDHLQQHPEAAPDVARYLDLRLEHGPGARPLLRTLTAALLRDHPAPIRSALLPVFATPGTHLSQPLRHELLDAALETERDPDVLAALLSAAALAAPTQHPLLTRDLVHRLALLLTRTPQGAARFDRTVVALAAEHPSFAHLLRTWLTDTTWDTLLGPSARHDLLVAS
ncbi:serine protease [Streptomyces sp. NPDC088194]|uniref:serine protease n=1 Tax=Streptomyces sp. NPDC088194 TaxID=3154931 RepID=UPI00344C96A3